MRLQKTRKNRGLPGKIKKLAANSGVRSSLGSGDDADLALFLAELDRAVAKRKEREIPTATHVAARTEPRAALTHDDRTGADALAAKRLDTQKLRFAVATVAAAGLSLFMCHDTPSFLFTKPSILFKSQIFNIAPKRSKVKAAAANIVADAGRLPAAHSGRRQKR